MLVSLFVKDFAIVREVEIAPRDGLTVVSGETGAGKSLLVDALMLLTGARADAGAVRHGAERAELAARFAPAADSPALAWLRENDLDEDAECQLRRVIRADGGSRAWINGRPATVTQLAALGALLVEIHGQHEHQALLDRRHQLELLDAFAGHADALAGLRDSARGWQQANQAIEALLARGSGADRRLFLEHQLEELASENLGAEAIEALEAEHRRQSHATALIEGCGRAAEALEGELPERLRRLRQELSRLAAHEPGLEDVDALLDGAQIQLDEAAATLARLREDWDLDPQRLATLEARLARLHDLARKHRVPLTELGARQAALAQELESLDGSEARLAALLQERERCAAGWSRFAAEVSAGRARAADALSRRTSALMDGLGMAGGRFEVALEALGSADPHADGAERAEFLVSANAGQPPRPLRKVASGGELSRISLAIQVATLGLNAVATMVFDEVDTGIGGAVAEIVGQELRALGAERQVLCVTHLPRVAAQGHHHVLVSKTGRGDSGSQVQTLDAEARVNELARMLGGVDITEATLAHARQMLEHARRRA